MGADDSENANRQDAMNKQTHPDILGIFGDPIGHTLSPVIHRIFGERNGISLEYLPFCVKGEDLEAAVRGAHALGIKGLNITVPHKSAVIPFLSDIDPLAEKIGAVNTLVREKDGYRGYNTDATGLKKALEREGVTFPGERFVILGAGGAGRAAAFLCAYEGAADVAIVNRSEEKAAALAEEIKAATGSSSVRAVDMESFISGLEKDGLRYIAIQCTSVGLWPHDDCTVTDDPRFFAGLSFAADVIYRPMTTRFLRQARDAGVPTMGGLSMLLFQAVDAFRLWYPDCMPDDDAIETAMSGLVSSLTGCTDIVLTGFMGSGKTTVAGALAKKLGADVWDTDAMIEEACGKSISDIFAEDGEEVFRRMETLTLARISEAHDGSAGKTGRGVIVSAGGGLPVRAENREILKSGNCGRVVYLKVTPKTVLDRLSGDDTRPLLAGSHDEKLERIEKLMAEREESYAESADIVIRADGLAPELVADMIIDAMCAGEDRT